MEVEMSIEKKYLNQSKNPTYMIAHLLREQGAPIEFNLFNLDLCSKDINIKGKIESWYNYDKQAVSFVFNREVEE